MSDERVNVSKGLLDKLSDSVQALTGTAEIMSIQEMSNAVNKKANERFELIETIVLTEEVKAVQRTKEPDGTDYNFKEMLVEISFPTRYKMGTDYNLGITQFRINGLAPYYASVDISKSSGVDTNNLLSSQFRTVRLYAKIDKNLKIMRTEQGYSGSAYGINGLGIDGSFNYTTKSRITEFYVRTTRPFPVAATPTIKIYGIRA